MRKFISLKKLNEEGTLILTFKKHTFLRDEERHPSEYANGKPDVCYIHYYHDRYIVTRRVIETMQIAYYSYADALRNFKDFIGCVEY